MAAQPVSIESEEWLDVPGYEGRYQVSNLGRIKSLARTARHYRGIRRVRESIRIQRKCGPYLMVSLHDGAKSKTFRTHRLVCLAFHGPQPEGKVVAHNDGVSTNNRADNLRWATPVENAADKVKHGSVVIVRRPKLTEEIVNYIRANRHLASKVLAAQFGVNIRTINYIRLGRTWRHIL